MVFRPINSFLLNMVQSLRYVNTEVTTIFSSLKNIPSSNLNILVNEFNAAKAAGTMTGTVYDNFLIKVNRLSNGNASLINSFQQLASSGNNARASLSSVYSSMLNGNTQGISNIRNIISLYNSLGNSTGVVTQEQVALSQAVGASNTGLGNYLTITDGATASMMGYGASLIYAKIQTMALKAATMALQSIVVVAIGYIVGHIVTVINASQKAIEEFRELGETASQETNEIKDLYEQYRAMSKEYEIDTSKKEDLIGITDSLLKKLGYETTTVEELTSKYNSLDEAIQSVTLKGLKEKEEALLAGYNSAKNAMISDEPSTTAVWWAGSEKWFKTSMFVGADKTLPKLELDMKNLIKDADLFNLEGDDATFISKLYNSSVENVIQNYKDITEAIDLLKSKYSNEELSQSSVFTTLIAEQENYKVQLENYDKSVLSLNDNLAQQLILTSLIGKELPKTKEEFNDFKNGLLSVATDDKWSDKFVGGTDNITNSIELALQEMPEFAEFFNITKEQTKSAIPTVQSLSSAYEELAEKIEDVLKKQKDLADAYKKVVSGEVYTPTEAFELLSQYPELYEAMSKVDGDFTFSTEGIKAAFEKQNDELVDTIKGNIEENQNRLNQYITDYNNYLKTAPYNIKSQSDYENYQSKINTHDGIVQGFKDEIENNQILLEVLADNNFDTEEYIALQEHYEQVQKAADEAKSAISDYNSQIETVMSAEKKVAEGTALTYDELMALKEINPQLAYTTNKTKDAFYVEAEALATLRDETYNTRNAYIDNQIETTKETIQQVKIRIATYEAELRAIVSYQDYLQKAGIIKSLASDTKELEYLEGVVKELEARKNNISYESDTSSVSDTNDIIQNQIDYYQMLLDAIQIVADKRIEALEAEKDALKEKNDEEQRELDLIEAKNNLDKARKQKVFVYEEGKGLVQVQDKKAVADAEKELKDAENAIKEAEIDKKISAIEDYSKQYSEMANNIQDTLTVEQAKQALNTDENGLMNLPVETGKAIRDGMAEATLKKDKEDNEENPYYQNVTLADFLKAIGAAVTPQQFMEQSATWKPVVRSSTYEARGTVTETINNSTTNNNGKVITFAPVINITESQNPQATATAVRSELGKFLTEFNNRIK